MYLYTVHLTVVAVMFRYIVSLTGVFNIFSLTRNETYSVFKDLSMNIQKSISWQEAGVIQEIKGSVCQIYKRLLFCCEKHLKGTSDFNNSMFTVYLHCSW